MKLFSEQATRVQKVATYGLLVLIGLAAVGTIASIGLVRRVHVYAKPMRVLSLMALCLSAILIAAVVYYRMRWIRIGEYSWKSLFGLLIGAPMLLHVPIARGIPAAVHVLSSSPAEEIVTITGKTSGRYCPRGLYVAEFPYISNNEICGIRWDDWEEIRVGDTLRLVGRGSVFGFSFHSYQRS